ncbi:protein of unknown function [Kyrpidia spormannii]|uniref:Uncharacterized protein n=1 Tax=Kyrpidia spormannii TaxID=2055160 RepID=A0ACA8Z7V2_9BACL|nr:protein of unknown function [Kyrpidia spormannii]
MHGSVEKGYEWAVDMDPIVVPGNNLKVGLAKKHLSFTILTFIRLRSRHRQDESKYRAAHSANCIRMICHIYRKIPLNMLK